MDNVETFGQLQELAAAECSNVATAEQVGRRLNLVGVAVAV